MKYKINSIASLAILKSIVIVFVIALSSCQQNATDLSGLRQVCFDKEVLPLFQSSCATTDCHDAASEGGFMLDSYKGILEGISSGDPHNSAIYKSIISTSADHMPPDTLLAMEDRVLIRVWIEQGAANTICIEPPDSIINDTVPPPYSNPYVCFERDILPVMQSSCGITDCHDPITMEEEFDFTTYLGIRDGLIPGDPLRSKIYKAISEVEQSNLMPPLPYSRLSKAQIDSIYNWIANGAPDEYCGEACDTTDITFTSHLASVLTNNCTGCHSGTTPQGGVRLESYANLVTAANSGAVPAVLRASGYPLMPPGMALSECDIRKFEIWIENGMPN